MKTVGGLLAFIRTSPIILARQAQTNRAAVISQSTSWPVPTVMTVNGVALNPAILDFGRVWIQRMTAANVAVLVAAGNTGAQPVSSLLTQSPMVSGGGASPMIVVGATDANGNRAPFSEYRDGGNNIVALLAIGTNVQIPYWSQTPAYSLGTAYTNGDGTSLATPMIAGILGNLMSRDPTVTGLNARYRLTQIALARKGGGWLIEPPSQFVIPRMATDTEISCQLAQGQAPAALYTATWYPWSSAPTAYVQPAAAVQGLADYLQAVPANVSTPSTLSALDSRR
jgi:hypothetical protein